MSATAAPYGMVPVATAGGYNTQGFETLPIADAYATSIYFGDVVKTVAAGTIEKDTGTTALTPTGIFVGCRYVNSQGQTVDAQSWPGGTTTGGTVTAKVVTDPTAVFKIQCAGSVTQAMVGANADIVQTAGTAAIGKSRNAMATTTPSTSATRPLRILGFLPIPENAVADAFTDVLVKFNIHQRTNTTGI